MKKIIGIIGGGPAGMSCALWLKHLGFYPIIIEKSEQLGGLQNINPFHNKWYLGLPGKTGVEFAHSLRQHVELELIPTLFDAQLKRITGGDGFRLLTTKHDITAQGLVIATGQRCKGHKTIASIAGSAELLSSPRVCYNPGTVPMNPSQVVAVVGGGDNGLGTVLMLAEAAQHIHLFVRSNLRGFGFNRKGVLEYINAGKVTLHQSTLIQRFKVEGEKISIEFKVGDQSPHNVRVDHLYFRLGYAPNVEDIMQLLEREYDGLKLTPDGYLWTDQFQRTSIPKLYGIGDVTNPRDPCVATAVAHGAIAARSIDEDLQ